MSALAPVVPDLVHPLPTDPRSPTDLRRTPPEPQGFTHSFGQFLLGLLRLVPEKREPGAALGNLGHDVVEFVRDRLGFVGVALGRVEVHRPDDLPAHLDGVVLPLLAHREISLHVKHATRFPGTRLAPEAAQR